jgi:hypothetical protein
MFLDITEKLNRILKEFEVTELPNTPNIGGIIDESEISFVITSGEIDTEDRDTISHRINISVSATMRKNVVDKAGVNCGDIEKFALYDLVEKVIFKVHKQYNFKFVNYEFFTPESGKWRSLLVFSVKTRFTSDIDKICEEI